MSDKQYYYAVARIRSKELTLLSAPFIEQLMGAKTVAEALRMLQEPSSEPYWNASLPTVSWGCCLVSL